MLKTITLFLLMTIFTAGTIYPQTLSKSSKESQMTLNEAISKDTEKHNAEAVPVTVENMEKVQAQPQPGHWSTKKKLLVIGALIVIAGLAAVLVYNGKTCLKTSPSSCNFYGDDPNCRCVEYSK